jgi:aspartyl-tRNA(Asn)/glutamyl-tRNA(Gln) amidotransferase subunit A
MSLAAQFLDGSFVELRRALDSGELSSEQLCVESLRRLTEQSELNAFISWDETSILGMARDADQRLKRGERSPVLGVPVSVKDLIHVRNQRTTAGSRFLSSFVAPFDAGCVKRLRAAGAVLFGKTNLDEFAMGSSNETSFFGPVRNPWDKSRVPGGSSGGSAAAVAARITPLSLGTDTGGSIRQPASLCGAVGLKPTYGRVSRFGVVAFASSLDQVGPIAADAQGAAALMEVISGFDDHDSTSSQTSVPSYTESLSTGFESQLGTVKIACPREFFEEEGLSAEVRSALNSAVETYRSQGAQIVECSLPHLKHSLAAYYLICSSEASSNLARYSGVHFGHRTSLQCENLKQLISRSRSEGFG